MSDSKAHQTQLHEGDVVVTLKLSTRLLFTKKAVQELHDLVLAFAQRVVWRSEAIATNRETPVVSPSYVKDGAHVETDDTYSSLRGALNVLGGVLLGVPASTIWEVARSGSSGAPGTVVLAITSGILGATLITIGIFGWHSLLVALRSKARVQ